MIKIFVKILESLGDRLEVCVSVRPKMCMFSSTRQKQIQTVGYKYRKNVSPTLITLALASWRSHKCIHYRDATGIMTALRH